MYYEDSIIDEVRSRNDIVQIIGTYVKLKRAGSNYQGLCPFHSEKTPSFSVSPSRQTYKCFGCGKGGNVFTFLMEYENLSFPEALRNLADRVGIQLPQAELSEEARRQADLRTNLLELYKKAATFYYRKFYSEDGKFAREYIVGRGLSAETMKNFGIGYSDGSLYKYLKEEGYRDEFLAKSGLFTFDEKRGVNDKFFNRVMFPSNDAQGECIAFGGRVIGDGGNGAGFIDDFTEVSLIFLDLLLSVGLAVDDQLSCCAVRIYSYGLFQSFASVPCPALDTVVVSPDGNSAFVFSTGVRLDSDSRFV